MAGESICQRLPFKVILVWMIVVAVCYNLLLTSSNTENGTAITDNTQLMHIPASHLVDAVVFIAMGKMASDPMVDYSIASVRKLGKWKGEIFVITDSPGCFIDTIRDHSIQTVEVPSAKSIIEIKSLKTKLMSLVPEHINGILYVDVDILVTKNLATFLTDLGSMVFTKTMQDRKKNDAAGSPSNTVAASSGHLDIDPDFDFAAFHDAKGHYVGFCSGCEKWHTGVMWFRRGKGETCLRKWEEILLSGKYDTDQQSLDSAELELIPAVAATATTTTTTTASPAAEQSIMPAAGRGVPAVAVSVSACPNALHFPARHLLFAKDYIGMVLTSGQTFIHLTAAGRPETQDYFYREIVVPRIQNSLHPPLNPGTLLRTKICSSTASSSSSSSAVSASASTSTITSNSRQ
mmetsp:Transcript_13329/g.22305  ORF Transcript_13329/g.22305 Transcript_13329/m.22305 type:complete len:405 (-) Transcript_13329:50-1264(-)